MTKAPDFRSMTGPQLVACYNEMLDTAVELLITWHKPVTRFASQAQGVRRCEELHVEIQKAAQERRDEGKRVPASVDKLAEALTVHVTEAPQAKPAPKAKKTSAGGTRQPRAALSLDTRVRVLVKKNPRTTVKTQTRFEFWKDGKTIRQYAEEFPHPKGKTESGNRAMRDFKRGKREGWLDVFK